MPVNGDVADLDGVQGLAGTHVWRLAETAAVAAGAGGLAAAAEAAVKGESVTELGPLGGVAEIVTGNLGRYAASKGASRAAQEIEKIVAKRLEGIVPAVYVANGKKLTVCFIDGVTLDGIGPADITDAPEDPFHGLDVER